MAMDGICRKSFIALLVVWSVLELNEVHGQDIVIDCQTVRDGDVSTFRGTLNKANISSVCDALDPSKVTFLLTYPTTVTDVLCEQKLSPCNPVENAEGCRCVSEGANAYTFEFNFRFNKLKYEGSTLSLTTDCLSSATNGLTSNDPCDLKEATPTMPPTTETTVASTTPPPNTTSEPPGATTASSESPISPTATGSPTATSTGNSSTSGPAIPPTGNSGTSGPAIPPTGNSSTSGPASPTTGNSSTSSSTDSTPIATSPGTTGNSSSTAARHSDQALYIGLGFVGLVCLVGIVVVCVLIVRRRKSRKKLATASANDGNPDQEEKNNHAYINTTL